MAHCVGNTIDFMKAVGKQSDPYGAAHDPLSSRREKAARTACLTGSWPRRERLHQFALWTVGGRCWQKPQRVRRGGKQEAAVALHIENVDRHRVNVSGRQLTEDGHSRAAEELPFQSGHLIGREGPEGSEEVGGKARIPSRAVLQPAIRHRSNALSSPYFAKTIGNGRDRDGAAGKAGSEACPLHGSEKECFIPPNAPAERRTGFVPAELGTRCASAIQEKIVGVEPLILQEVGHCAVKVVRPAARDQLNIP